MASLSLLICPADKHRPKACTHFCTETVHFCSFAPRFNRTWPFTKIECFPLDLLTCHRGSTSAEGPAGAESWWEVETCTFLFDESVF
jgi:hypothetical protein